jgi:hypothetical protein
MDEPPPNAPALPSGPRPAGRERQSSVLGLLLVLAGVVLLLAQFVHVDLGHYGWPLFVIVPGVALLIIAVTSRGFVGEGLAILGSVLTITGLILLYQNATDHFESWAYAWALVFPGAVGIGMILYGAYAGRPGNLRAGGRLLGVGLVLFLLGAAFFEGVIGIGGYRVGQSAGAIAGILIIGVGALLLILSLTSRRSGLR